MVQLYNTKQIFSNPSIGRAHDLDLTQAFYNARYNDHGKLINKSFFQNAGAVQLFNINGIDTITDAHSSISTRIYNTSLGHSERIGMRDILNEFIPDNTGEIEQPNYYVQSPNPDDHQIEILTALVNHANEYRQYLTNSNAIVKMCSERKPCDYHQDGGKCLDFINKIFPDNSVYGYITEVPQYSTAMQIATFNEIAFNNFANEYLLEIALEGLSSLFADQYI